MSTVLPGELSRSVGNSFTNVEFVYSIDSTCQSGFLIVDRKSKKALPPVEGLSTPELASFGVTRALTV